MARSSILAAILAVFLATPAPAQTSDDVGQILAKAKASIEADKPLEAFMLIEAAQRRLAEQQRALWEKMPLGFRFVQLGERGASAQEIRRKADNVYAAKAPIVVSFQPVGFGWKREGDRYEARFLIDYEIIDSGGRAVRLRRDSQLRHAQGAPFFQFSGTLQIGNDLPAGAYRIKLSLRDETNQKKADSEIAFEVKG